MPKKKINDVELEIIPRLIQKIRYIGENQQMLCVDGKFVKTGDVLGFEKGDDVTVLCPFETIQKWATRGDCEVVE